MITSSPPAAKGIGRRLFRTVREQDDTNAGGASAELILGQSAQFTAPGVPVFVEGWGRIETNTASRGVILYIVRTAPAVVVDDTARHDMATVNFGTRLRCEALLDDLVPGTVYTIELWMGLHAGGTSTLRASATEPCVFQGFEYRP